MPRVRQRERRAETAVHPLGLAAAAHVAARHLNVFVHLRRGPPERQRVCSKQERGLLRQKHAQSAQKHESNARELQRQEDEHKHPKAAQEAGERVHRLR